MERSYVIYEGGGREFVERCGQERKLVKPDAWKIIGETGQRIVLGCDEVSI